ncbi:SMI1/KNR4 family protein [Paenibacillus sp. GCM10012306]|uniref:SMI1/KNR4 family protein n=1 Tax=Paenibacillus sp. GCM10012306 TaxID=3317342 RepID=UPI0036065F04
MGSNVLDLIEFLKRNASPDHTFQRLIPGLGEGPLECTWKDPVSAIEVNKFLQDNDWHFPEDYKQFLLKHNGAVLFQHPYYGGGTELLSLEQILLISKTYEQIPSICYPIAWTDHRIGAICIDSVKCQQGETPYLFFLDAMDHIEDAIPIPLTFTEWLDRLIICQGQEYWNW